MINSVTWGPAGFRCYVLNIMEAGGDYRQQEVKFCLYDLFIAILFFYSASSSFNMPALKLMKNVNDRAHCETFDNML